MESVRTQLRPSIAVVIPAKDASKYIGDCIDSVIEQLTEIDCIVVVDDGSSDETAAIAEDRGVVVIRNQRSIGPYMSRNIGRASVQSDALVFYDMRCRSVPGWLEAHRRSLASENVLLSYTNVSVGGGNRLAEKVARRLDPFSVSNYSRVNYYPTCNLGVLAEAFDAVEGFSDVHSGGDAEFCKKVSKLGGSVRLVEETLVTWQPRTTMKELLRQYSKYGESSARLAKGRVTHMNITSRLLLFAPRLLVKVFRSTRRDGVDVSALGALVLVQLAYEWRFVVTGLRLKVDGLVRTSGLFVRRPSIHRDIT